MKYLFIKCSKAVNLPEISSLCNCFKRLIIFSSPFIIFFGTYFIWDPFKVLYNYDNYYADKEYFIYKNRDFVSSEMYMKNHKLYKYDSFIFGSSTSLFFLPSSWKHYIDKVSSVFTFDASGESIEGIWSKIKFIHQRDNQINYALVVFDAGGTFRPFENKGHIFKKHYMIYPSSKFAFHYESFMSYLNFKFLVAVIHHKISHRFFPYMKDILEERNVTFDLITNEIVFKGPDQELKEDSLGYYNKRRNLFVSRSNNPRESEPQINKNHLLMLNEIKAVFDHDSTEYRIIISPLYEQISMNSADLNQIKEIFGADKVYNYSGINKYTAEISNFYDPHHFKTYLGDAILTEIYGK